MATIVGTLVCGDNYFVEQQEEAVARLLRLADTYDAAVLVAGPAFSSGRYGAACGTLALAWQRRGKTAVTAMNSNNPGVDLFRSEIYIVCTGPTVASMGEALPQLAALTLKLGHGVEIGPSDEEGYFPRGIRRNLRLEQGAAERGIEMLLAKLTGRPYQTELPIEPFDNVLPVPPVTEMDRALVALVTESGVVPSGNRTGSRRGMHRSGSSIRSPASTISSLTRSRHGTAAATRRGLMPIQIVPSPLTLHACLRKRASSDGSTTTTTSPPGTWRASRQWPALARRLPRT